MNSKWISETLSVLCKINWIAEGQNANVYDVQNARLLKPQHCISFCAPCISVDIWWVGRYLLTSQQKIPTILHYVWNMIMKWQEAMSLGCDVAMFKWSLLGKEIPVLHNARCKATVSTISTWMGDICTDRVGHSMLECTNMQISESGLMSTICSNTSSYQRNTLNMSFHCYTQSSM